MTVSKAGWRRLVIRRLLDLVQVVAKVTVERAGGEKPVCVAETVTRIYL